MDKLSISPRHKGAYCDLTSMLEHLYQDLIYLFNHCFAKTHNTVLVCGNGEPIYLPADEKTSHHQVIFAHGFFSSALHECAHWLIAGDTRRHEIDYGYWYVPEGRTAEQQALFQQVEIKPQALEWILSTACDFPFQFSIDNLNGDAGDSRAFKEAVREQVGRYHEQGLSPRAETFYAALVDFYSER